MAYRIKVTGIQRVITQFRRFHVKTMNLRDLWKRLATMVKQDAVPLTPLLTGTLRRSLKATASKKRGRVVAGNARMEPYAPIQHYGGYNNIQGKHFLTTALAQNAGNLERETRQEINRIIRSTFGA